MATIVLLVVVAGIVLWVIGAYNTLVTLKNQVVNAWKQIDVQLKRRHDLIPNLVNTVKGVLDFERATPEAIVSARNRAVAVTGGVRETARAEGELTQALGRLLALTEAYPEATQYNTKMSTFPTMLVTGLAKAAPAPVDGSVLGAGAAAKGGIRSASSYSCYGS